MNTNSTQTPHEGYDDESGKLLTFDPGRRASRVRLATESTRSDAHAHSVVAVVTVTRFIGNDRVHAQVPVFAEQIDGNEMLASDLKLTPELSELLADGAVEANSYLDRLSAMRAARTLREFSSSRSS